MALELREVDGQLEYVNEKGEACTRGGELIGGASPDYPIAKLFSDFYETPLGELFLEEYGLDTRNLQTGETNVQAVERVFARLYAHDLRPTLSRIIDTVKTAIAAGELTPAPKPLAASPRGANGRFATKHELLRHEVRQLLSDPTVSAQSIRERANKDRDFGDAFRAETAIQQSAPTPVDFDEETQRFADAYVKAPSLKPIAGFITLDGKKWPVADFTAMVNKAIAAGLLR
jgi:hypothetical protein